MASRTKNSEIKSKIKYENGEAQEEKASFKHPLSFSLTEFRQT